MSPSARRQEKTAEGTRTICKSIENPVIWEALARIGYRFREHIRASTVSRKDRIVVNPLQVQIAVHIPRRLQNTFQIGLIDRSDQSHSQLVLFESFLIVSIWNTGQCMVFIQQASNSLKVLGKTSRQPFYA